MTTVVAKIPCRRWAQTQITAVLLLAVRSAVIHAHFRAMLLENGSLYFLDDWTLSALAMWSGARQVFPDVSI